ncbi:MAG TPA: hypothetical protein VG147_12665 [Solirubrobacteraceae bacterium]|nr:hypothetical protein [Solirubrobacteraceae bacterium]
MPKYAIERAFAEQLDLSSDDKLIEEVNADESVRWLFSRSADRRRATASTRRRHPT